MASTGPSLLVTIVRHGESVDNLGTLWAGQRDSPLTNHGHAQAARLGQAFSGVYISSIYSSDLQRAFQTAQEIQKANLSDPRPEITISEVLREQNFGEAEGKTWQSGEFSTTNVPWSSRRDYRFPGGESLDDVSLRAQQAIKEYVLPHLLEISDPSTILDPLKPPHVVLVAHGITISEMMSQFFRLSNSTELSYRLSGLGNTAWNQLAVSLSDPERAKANDNLPALKIDLLHVNMKDHLKGLVRQKGGIGSSAFDERQKTMKDFFGGGNAGKM